MMISTLSDAQFERLVEMVRRDNPALLHVHFLPDGAYQTRTASLRTLTAEVTECLSEGLRRRGSAEFPTLYSAWGRCRVGSTALANLFGVAGLPSYQQPVKAILRQRLRGEDGEPIVPPDAAVHSHVFSKETAGPYVGPECLIIPLQALIEAGYPADRLKLIVIDREPMSSLASWLAIFGQRVPASVLVRTHVLAALNLLRVKSYAKRMGVEVSHYVHEASKEPVASMRALFTRLGLADRFNADTVTDWQGQGEIAAKKGRLIFTHEPKIYDVPGALRTANAYEYRIGAAAPLSAEHADMVTRFGIAEIYRESAKACAQDLGMDAATAARLFGSETAPTELLAAE
jgi:hypothetical protein